MRDVCFVDDCFQRTDEGHHFCESCWSLVPGELKDRFIHLPMMADATRRVALLEHLVLTAMALVVLRKSTA